MYIPIYYSFYLVFLRYLSLTEQNSRWPDQQVSWGLAKPQVFGGCGRIRTFEDDAADLQSAGFDHLPTHPYSLVYYDFALGSLREKFGLSLSVGKHNHTLPFFPSD